MEPIFMKTAVYQSFRTTDVPDWMTRCLASVSSWAEMRDFAYHFYDDEFFNYAPARLRTAVGNQRHLVSDVARLELAKELLNTYDRVIWIDADVYINNPANFLSAFPPCKFLFCQEHWVHQEGEKIIVSERVNNAVIVMERDNEFLDFYRYACNQVINEWKQLSHSAFGTIFLTQIHKMLRQPLLLEVGMFSPLLLDAARQNNRTFLDTHLKRKNVPINAANLCLTFFNGNYDGRKLDDSAYVAAMDYLDTLHK